MDRGRWLLARSPRPGCVEFEIESDGVRYVRVHGHELVRRVSRRGARSGVGDSARNGDRVDACDHNRRR